MSRTVNCLVSALAKPDCRSRAWRFSKTSDNAELQNQEGVIPQPLEESLPVLGIIRHTAKEP
jgi:hypothetical protein